MSNVETPVPPAPPARAGGTGSKRYIVVALIVAAALGFLLFRGLDEASLYFRTADEAVAQRQELGNQRFRIEGTVVPGTIAADGPFTNFAIASKGTTVQVRNSGQPLGIFQENIPVVLEGRFADDTNLFESDRIMVMHDNNYEAEYPERVSGELNR